MVNWTLFMVLILPPMVYLDRGVSMEKAAGVRPVCTDDTGEFTHKRRTVEIGEKGLTPVCCNDTMAIMLIVCEIRMERRMGPNCSLLYRHGQEFEDGCDSRFGFMERNETVFIQWEGLTPEHHGNITCECSRSDGTFILQLSVRPDAPENGVPSSEIPEQLFPLIGGASVIIITAAIFGLVYRRLRHRKQAELPPNMDPPDIDPYSTFIQRDSGLYSTVKLSIMNN